MLKEMMSKKITAVTLALAVMLSAVLLPIGYTLASSDINVVLTQPNTYPTIEKGTTYTVSGAGYIESDSGDTSVATVVTSGGVPKVTGKKAGVITIAVGSKTGLTFAFNYQITDSANISAYVIKDGGKVTLSGAGKTKASPVTVTAGTNNIVWSSLDTDVATVNETTGAITGVSKGAAIILGKFTDKWGVDRDIHILVGVGINLGNKLGELIDLINKGQEILDNPNNGYSQESLDNLQDAVDAGIAVVNSNNPDDNTIQNAIDDLIDALSNMKDAIPADVIKGDDGKYYKEVAPNVFEEVNSDGSSKQPPRYVYNSDKKPGNGHDKPVNKFGGGYWVNCGQNVWQKVDNNGQLGSLTGGGADRDPTTDPVLPIYDNTAKDGRYYVGPLGPDSYGNYYYYGDPKTGGDGYLDSDTNALYGDDVKYYKDSDGNMTTTKPSSPITETPTIADDGSGNGGRVLTDAQTGDGKWVEIARNGDYSLIVRANYINTYASGHYNDPTWQYVNYASAVYANSTVNKAINDWFNGNVTGDKDKLSATAKLRQFTVQNNAISVPGTSSSMAGMTNGFSKPTNVKIPSGSNDVAFALSYGEAANFCSVTHDIRPIINDLQMQPSSSIAQKNFAKITIPAYTTGYRYGAWLRSPGDVAGTMGALNNDGRAFQFQLSHTPSEECGLVYPALWVDSAIFDTK